MKKIKNFPKESAVRVKKLMKDFTPANADSIELYFRESGQIGTILYPYYSTLNRVWCVKHENGTTALYHSDELESVN